MSLLYINNVLMPVFIITGIFMAIALGAFFMMSYMRQQRVQNDREELKLELERQRLQKEEGINVVMNTEQDKTPQAGLGSGGYIVVEMPEKDRSLFHDLLKGFEDYAKLKGYEISFSIDASFAGKIAFKFTIHKMVSSSGQNASGRTSMSTLRTSRTVLSKISTTFHRS